MGKARAIFALKETDRGWNEIRRVVKTLRDGDSHVKVGLLGDAALEPVEGAELDVVGLGLLHEYGSKDGVIPERSWIRSTFDMNRAAYVAQLRGLMGLVLAGKLSVEKALNIMGLKIASDIRKRVTTSTGVPPPNAPSTMRRKLAKGERSYRGKGKRKREGPVQSPRPLVDTGRMIGAVQHLVVLKQAQEGAGNGE